MEVPALTPRPHLCAVLILVGVGLEAAPSPGERPSTRQQPPWPCACGGLAGPFRRVRAPRPEPARLPPQVSPAPSSSCRASCYWSQEVRAGAGAGRGRGGAELRADRPRPAVYHVVFIYCAVKGYRGFQFFYLPYFEK